MYSCLKRFKAAPRSPSKSEDSSRLLPLEEIPSRRRPYGLGDLPNQWTGVLHGPRGLLIQPNDPVDISTLDAITEGNHDIPAGDNPFFQLPAHSRHKKQVQWNRWVTDVIPSLVKPYMELMRITESLRNPVPAVSHACLCRRPSKILNVVCVHFHSEWMTIKNYTLTIYFVVQKSTICRSESANVVRLLCSCCDKDYSHVHPVLHHWPSTSACLSSSKNYL